MAYEGPIVPSTRGGTDNNSFTTGDILYANSPTSLTKLNIGGSTQVLHGGTTPSYSSVSLTTDVTGILPANSGGTGVNNGSNTITLSGSLITTGAFGVTFNFTAGTNVTFPTSGTLATTSGTISSVVGTANQITASTSVGSVTLSIPSNFIAPGTVTATTSFITTGTSSGNVTIQSSTGTYNFNFPSTAGTSGYFLTSGGGGTNAMTWTSPSSVTVTSITGTANQVLANGTSGASQTGSVTLTTPQNIGTASSPTFGGLTITGFSGVVKAVTGVLSASAIVNADLSAGSFTNITGVGTLTAGTWNATKISEIYGGTNQSTYATGDTLYASAANTLSKLSGNITATKKFLTQTGNGSVSAAPAWGTISASDIPGSALTKTDDTNVTLTLGGSPSTALLNAASITAGWTGQLSVSRGGTGATAFTQGSIVFAGASGVYSQDNANFFWDATNHQLRVGTTTAPTSTTAITSFVGTRQANYVLSGNSIDGAGSSTDGIALSMMHNTSGNRQFTIVDSTLMASSSLNVAVRIIPSSGSIDAIATDGTTFKQLVLGNSTSGTCLIGNSGVGSSIFVPLNKLDVNGAVAIGSYAGNNTAPSNGLIVSGTVGIGTTNPGSYPGGLVVADSVAIAGNSSLPTQAGGSIIWFAAGYSSPISGRLFIGDGTGWKFTMSKRTSSVTSDLFYFRDAPRLGIGADPSNSLDVNGAVAIGSYAGNNTAPSNGLIVSGNVGIGTTTVTSGYVLEVNGNIKSSNILSSSYTPTLTNIISVNAASSTIDTHYYMVIGSVVIVSGNIICVASATTNQFSFRISLPISSTLASNSQAQGVGNSYSVSGTSNTCTAFISADTVNHQVQFSVAQFSSNITSGNSFRVMYTFQYQVV